jgi:hypothetical protein
VTGKPKTPPVEAPCTCLTVRHEHGDYLRYKQDGCRCVKCRAAEAARAARRYRLEAYGMWQPTISPVGARRRLEALMTMGWPTAAVAAMCGMQQPFAARILQPNRRCVHLSTHRRIAAVYDELWDKRPPETTKAERHRASRARNTARARGYAVPLAWDEDTIDDPSAVPARRGRLVTGYQRDRYLDLISIGCTHSEIALKYGVDIESVARTLQRAEAVA